MFSPEIIIGVGCVLVGGPIGVYAAEKHTSRTPASHLSAPAVMIGAGFGTLLLALLPLAVEIRNDTGPRFVGFLHWVATGIVGAVVVGGLSVLRRSRTR